MSANIAFGINTSALWDALSLDCPIVSIKIPGTLFSSNTSHLRFAEAYGLKSIEKPEEIDENWDEIQRDLVSLRSTMLPNLGETGVRFIQAISEILEG